MSHRVRNACCPLVVLLLSAGCREQAPPDVSGSQSAPDQVLLVADGFDLQSARTGNARVVPVAVCEQSGNSDCLSCESASLGLKLDREVKVKCSVVSSGQCWDENARVAWRFDLEDDELAPAERYRAVVSHEVKAPSDPSKPQTPDAYCALPNECEDSGPPDKLVVTTKRPKLRGMDGATVTYWTYRIDLWEVPAQGDPVLVACADPEIIVTPPRGVAPPAAAP